MTPGPEPRKACNMGPGGGTLFCYAEAVTAAPYPTCVELKQIQNACSPDNRELHLLTCACAAQAG